MQKKSFSISWGNSSLEMLPSKALLLPQTNELLICDVHLGKAEYFQQNGIPLTNNSDEQNLLNIKKIVENYKPYKLIILGHGPDKQKLKNISFLEYKRSSNFIFSHEPIGKFENNILNICGHYHPKISLKNSKDKLSFKCFAMDEKNNTLYLPAFGDLTGGYPCKDAFRKWAIISEKEIIAQPMFAF